MITRKAFLQIGSLSLISLLLPTYVLSRVPPTTPDIKNLLKIAKKYRKQGKFSQAKEVYENILLLDPKEIRVYNGLRKILLRGKNKEFEVIKLYERALSFMPDNLRLKRALYNEYFKAAVGNRKVAKQLGIPGRLLDYTRDRYLEIAAEYPEKLNIQNQIKKIDRYIQLNVDVINPHKNIQLKAYRKSQKQNHKDRFKLLSSEESKNRLSLLKAKPFSKDRQGHIREMSKTYILALRKEKKYTEAFSAVQNILSANNSDPYFIKHFRSLGNQLKMTDSLLEFETRNHASKKTFWSAVALFDANLRKAESQAASPFKELDSLLEFMEKNKKSPNEHFELVTRRITSHIVKGDLQLARGEILTQCRNMYGVSNAHLIDRLNVLTARYFVRGGDGELADRIISIATNPNFYIESEDEMEKNIAMINSNRSYEKTIHIENLRRKISTL